MQLAEQLIEIVDQTLVQFKQLSDEDWSHKPQPEKWSKKEILGHLIDSALNNLRRFVVSQYEQNQNIVYQQNEWVEYQCYQQANVAQLVELWQLLNAQIARTISHIPANKLANTCDTGKGEADLHTILFLITDYISHLQHHLDAILPPITAQKTDVKIDLAKTEQDLIEILALQLANHRQHIPAQQGIEEGFVTVKHNLVLLTEMNKVAPQIIAKVNGKVAAYALVMLPSFGKLIPELVPMFKMLQTLSFEGKPIVDYEYYVMGQVCIDANYRGIGIFDKLYQKHKDIYAFEFDLCITEISTSNWRSMRAHERVGFTTIHTFKDAIDEWNVVAWNWK